MQCLLDVSKQVRQLYFDSPLDRGATVGDMPDSRTVDHEAAVLRPQRRRDITVFLCDRIAREHVEKRHQSRGELNTLSTGCLETTGAGLF